MLLISFLDKIVDLLQLVSEKQKKILIDEEVVTSENVNSLSNEAWENLKKKINTKSISELSRFRPKLETQGKLHAHFVLSIPYTYHNLNNSVQVLIDSRNS